IVGDLGHLGRAGVRGLEVRERARGPPRLDEQSPQIGAGVRVVGIRTDGLVELADSKPSVDGPRDVEDARRDVAVAGRRDDEHDRQGEDGVAGYPRDEAEEKETSHRLGDGAADDRARSMAGWAHRAPGSPSRAVMETAAAPGVPRSWPGFARGR